MQHLYNRVSLNETHQTIGPHGTSSLMVHGCHNLIIHTKTSTFSHKKKGKTYTHTLTNQESRMKSLHLSSSSFTSPQLITNISQQPRKQQQTGRNLKPHAAKSGGLSLKSVYIYDPNSHPHLNLDLFGFD